jgi:hypothetical protein
MKNPKITLLTILVIVLVILNVGIISIMWMHHPKSEHYQKPPFILLEEGLDMTPDQKESYKELRLAHRKLMENTRIQASGIRIQLHHFDVVKSDSMISILTDSLGKLHAAMELGTYEHFAKVRNICTPEQQKKFDLIIPDILKRFAGAAHGHKERRGHHPEKD